MTSARLEPARASVVSVCADHDSGCEVAGASTATFDAFVHENQAALVRYATLLSGSVVHGEDLVQEVLTRMFPRWDTVSVRAGSLHAYVRRAITNEYLSWRRRWSTRHIHLVDDDVLNRVPDNSTAEPPGPELWSALHDLPRQQRAALVLRYYEGLNDAEIADVLNCQPVTVRAYVSRGLTTLREHSAVRATREGGPS